MEENGCSCIPECRNTEGKCRCFSGALGMYVEKKKDWSGTNITHLCCPKSTHCLQGYRRNNNWKKKNSSFPEMWWNYRHIIAQFPEFPSNIVFGNSVSCNSNISGRYQIVEDWNIASYVGVVGKWFLRQSNEAEEKKKICLIKYSTPSVSLPMGSKMCFNRCFLSLKKGAVMEITILQRNTVNQLIVIIVTMGYYDDRYFSFIFLKKLIHILVYVDVCVCMCVYVYVVS